MLPGELYGAGDAVEYLWLGARGASPSVKLFNGNPVAWNPLSGVDREVDEIWRQDSPPPPGTHYAWLGEPHASASVRLDGDGNETARNHNSNGRFENGLSGWSSFHGGGITVLDRGTMFEGLSDSNYVGHLHFSATTGNTDNQGFYTLTSTPVGPGQFVALRSIMAVTGIGARDRQLVHWNMADGSTTYGSSYRTSTGTGIERKDVFQAPEGVESFQVRWHAQRNSAVGDFDFYATDMMFAVADSEDAALAQISTYFDGSTESDRANDLWYNQDGVPHEWENGQGWVEADNRFTPAPDNHQSLRIDTSLHGDIPDVIPGPNSPARDLRSIVMIDGVEREHDGWDIDRELNGDLPAQVVSSSGLMQATGRITFSDETVRNNARNPFNRGTGWIPRRGQEVRIYVEHKDQWFQRFQGVIDKVNGAVGGGMRATIIDGHDRFSAEVNHQPLLRIMPPLSQGGDRRGIGLTALYYIDFAARAAGYYCTPQRERNASLVVYGQTSVWPEAGTLQNTVPQNGQSHATNMPAPGWMGLSNFNVTYAPWGDYRASDPLQLTMMVGPGHAGIAYLETSFSGGSTVMLRADGSRNVYLRVNGTTVASLQMDEQDTVVSALIKSGQVTLRTNTGRQATGSQSLSGGVQSTAQIWAEAGAQVAGFQISHPDGIGYELASTRWTPNAWIDTGSVALYGAIDAGPRIVHRKAGNVLNEITDAILSAAWIDETGVLQVVPSDVLREKPPVRTVTTVDDVLALDWEDSVLQSPSRVTVRAKKPVIQNSPYSTVVVWEGGSKELGPGEIDEEFVEPSTNEEWIQVQSDLVQVNAHSAASLQIVNNNRRTVGGGYYALDGDWNDTPQPDGFTVTMDTLGINKYLIRHEVHTAPSGAVLVCGVPKDHPSVWDTREGNNLPRINAFGSVQWTDEQVSATTVSGPGPELVHDAGPWAARPDSTDTIDTIASYIAGQVASPQPVIRNLEIFPDPRLQLGDMIDISSNNLLGVRITALIVGISEGMDRSGGMTQSLTVRIRNVRTTAETYQGWEDALSSGSVTYSALNNLPPSPQTYEHFNQN